MVRPLVVCALLLVSKLVRADTCGGVTATTLAQCPETGCANPQTAPEHALLNKIKRTFPAGATAYRLSAADFKWLQTKATALVGQKKKLADRAKLHDLKKGRRTFNEGDFVETTGYVIAARAAGKESVNCKLSGKEKDNDIHVVIAEWPDATECEGIVVETIPQSTQRQSGKWTRAKLAAVSEREFEVLIRGQLFYDNMHKVNAPCPTKSKEPKRFSLWEIHPVAAFYVCDSEGDDEEGGCDPDDLSTWTPLESFEP